MTRHRSSRPISFARLLLGTLLSLSALALEEFSAMEERHQFLTEQLEDLKKTKRDLLEIVRERMEWWFSGKATRSYLHLDRGLGAVVAYPDEFFHIEQMNDHHFHYGYWIRTIAELALRNFIEMRDLVGDPA